MCHMKGCIGSRATSIQDTKPTECGWLFLKKLSDISKSQTWCHARWEELLIV